MRQETSGLAQVVERRQDSLLEAWMHAQSTGEARRVDLISEANLRRESAEFLRLLREALQSGSGRAPDTASIRGPEWNEAREMLTGLSRSRALAGFTPTETANFVFSLKQPLFTLLQEELGEDTGALLREIYAASELIDRLGLWTTEVFQRTREDIIARQQMEMMELSTPVVKLWQGVLALPLIGTLDSARTQVVMEALLQAIVDTGSEIAIIDITGVPTVDTLVAQHLLKTVAAARLMGAECIISGIRPQIAQTIVHLGVDLGDVTTKATLADAFLVALRKYGHTVNRNGGRGSGSSAPVGA